MEFECTGLAAKKEENANEWQLCKNERERGSVLKESTFALIPCAINDTLLSTPIFLVRLYEALKYGAIPVILGSDQIEMPYDEVRTVILNVSVRVVRFDDRFVSYVGH